MCFPNGREQFSKYGTRLLVGETWERNERMWAAVCKKENVAWWHLIQTTAKETSLLSAGINVPKSLIWSFH